MAGFTTSDPRSSGRAAAVGATVFYVTGGVATLLYKYGGGGTDWCMMPPGGGAEPVTADPRSSGLSRTVGSAVMYVAGGAGLLLLKYGGGSTEWCSAINIVPTPPASSTDFLRADGTWAVPAGVPPTRLISTTTPLTGGGDLSADRALAVNTFGAAQAGVVPLSGGGTANFLRADGTWTAPPGGGGISLGAAVALGAGFAMP